MKQNVLELLLLFYLLSVILTVSFHLQSKAYIRRRTFQNFARELVGRLQEKTSNIVMIDSDSAIIQEMWFLTLFAVSYFHFSESH